MDISNIPKTFWYSASFCIVLLTISFVVIAWKSTSLTIEIANAKIGLSQAATRTEVVNEQLRQYTEELNEERNQLESLRAEILELASHAGTEPGRGIASIPPPAGADSGDEAGADAVTEGFSENIKMFNKFDKSILTRLNPPEEIKNKRKEKLEKISKELDMTQMQIQQIKK